MVYNCTQQIETCFAECGNDGEFVRHDRAVPYSLIGVRTTSGNLIFTTKPATLSALFEACNVTDQLGIVGRYGLPDAGDVRWIRSLARGHSLAFLGDMDPVDLMIFVWLREKLRPIPIAHLGINDEFLKVLRIDSIKARLQAMAPSEEKSVPVLGKIFLDVRDAVGQKCARVLERRQKLELESILVAKLNAEQFLQAVMSSRRNP